MKYTQMGKGPANLLIAFALLINGASAFVQDTVSYRPLNTTEVLLNESSLIIAPLDDWGLYSSLSHYGLPEYAVQIDYLGLEMSDPLYGSVPVSWLNPRQQKLTVNSSDNRISFAPVFADSGVNYSRFDYYRGDYGFLDFSAELAGNLSNNIIWHLYGEKLGYDGAYGLLGPDIYNLKESIVQNYFLDIRKFSEPWTILAGTSYQKYFPGLSDAVTLGASAGETFLNWTSAGRLKEYRTNYYLSALRNTVNGTFRVGGQITNYLYNTRHDSSIYQYNAEAYQYAGVMDWIFRTGKGTVSIISRPMIENVFVRHSSGKNRILYRQYIEYKSSSEQLMYTISAGTANTRPVADLTLRYSAGKQLEFVFRTDLDYIRYPLSYFTDIGGELNAVPAEDGFTAFCQSVGINLRFRRNYLRSRVDYSRADFLRPYRSHLDITDIILQTNKLNRLYFTEEFSLELPLKTSIKGRGIYSPASGNTSDAVFQGWSRLTKDLYLFQDNLHLYLSADLHYLSGSQTIAWFEQLRTQGQTDTHYYTNERLALSAIIGARIGPFHIFYSIYNAEGRAFSPLPGALYRNRLKIFGVDWAFTN